MSARGSLISAGKPVFVQRCRVCGKEIETPWGPETHELSDLALRDHLRHHSFTALQDYAMREHFGSGGPT